MMKQMDLWNVTILINGQEITHRRVSTADAIVLDLDAPAEAQVSITHVDFAENVNM